MGNNTLEQLAVQTIDMQTEVRTIVNHNSTMLSNDTHIPVSIGAI